VFEDEPLAAELEEDRAEIDDGRPESGAEARLVGVSPGDLGALPRAGADPGFLRPHVAGDAVHGAPPASAAARARTTRAFTPVSTTEASSLPGSSMLAGGLTLRR
jgi:hypothetical protein